MKRSHYVFDKNVTVIYSSSKWCRRVRRVTIIRRNNAGQICGSATFPE